MDGFSSHLFQGIGEIVIAADGQVAGMVASTMLEDYKGSKWPAGISLAVSPTVISKALEGQLSTSTAVIKDSLRKHLP